MKKLNDIKNRNDIEKLINAFYEDVKNDKKLHHFFYKVDWEKHLPLMYTFWENVLFYTGNYTGNPMEQHQYLHKTMVMTKQHFNQWLKLFNQTVDKMFAGEKADLIKQKASNIATIMQLKILEHQH